MDDQDRDELLHKREREGTAAMVAAIGSAAFWLFLIVIIILWIGKEVIR